jgi:hypothetical protein
MSIQELKSSSEKIGQLYPILVDCYGHIIDGEHRLKADKNWRRIWIKDVKTKKDRIIARIVCNMVRRMVSDEEKTEQLGRLAEIYLEDGIEKGRIAFKIAEEVGMSYRWVAKYLPRKYKDKRQSDRARSVVRCAAKQPRVATKIDTLLQLSKPINSKFIVISKYANTTNVIYTVNRLLHDKIMAAAKKLNTTPETLVQNTIEETIKAVSGLDNNDTQLLQHTLAQREELH